MNTEDKELLLKDLCARLPYGVKLGFYASATKQTHICTLLGLEPQEDEPVIAKTENGSFYMLADHVKPYLFPLSSITEGQMEELKELCDMYTPDDDYRPYAYMGIQVLYKHVLDDNYEFNFNKTDVIDWCNKNHFDYRGLIPKGIALDATGKGIY